MKISSGMNDQWIFNTNAATENTAQITTNLILTGLYSEFFFTLIEIIGISLTRRKARITDATGMKYGLCNMSTLVITPLSAA